MENFMKWFDKWFDLFVMFCMVIFQFLAIFNVVNITNNTMFVFICLCIVRVVGMDLRLKSKGV